MGVPSRFPFGITNVTPSEPFGMSGLPDPTTYITYLDEFTKYTAGDWTSTTVGTTPTAALVNGDGGLLALTTMGSASSSIFLQPKTEFVLPVTGRKLFFKSRFKVSSLAGSNWIMGLTVTDTTPIGSGGTGVTDGMFWQSEAGTIKFYCQKDASTGQTSTGTTTVATMADDTLTELAFFWDGVQSIKLYQNGVQTATLDLGSTPASYLPDTTMTLQFGVQNTASTARVMTLDYVMSQHQRYNRVG